MKEYDKIIKNKYMSEIRTKKCDQSTTILLDSTHLTFAAIMVALGYISKLGKNSVTTSLLSHNNNSEVKILTLALMASMKAHYDNVYSNKSWSTVSGIPLKELNILESNFLRDINFNLYIDEIIFFKYMDIVENSLKEYYEAIADSNNKTNTETFENSNIPPINTRNFKRTSEAITPVSSPNHDNKKETLYKNPTLNTSQDYLNVPERDILGRIINSSSSLYSNDSSFSSSDMSNTKGRNNNEEINKFSPGQIVRNSSIGMSQNSVKSIQRNPSQNSKKTTSSNYIPKRTSSNNLSINTSFNFGYKNNAKVITLPNTQNFDNHDSHGNIVHSKSISSHQKPIDNTSSQIYRNKTVSLSNYPVATTTFSQNQIAIPYYQQQVSYSQPVYPYYMDVIYPVNTTPQQQYATQIGVIQPTLPLAPNPAMIHPQSINSGTLSSAIPSPLSPQSISFNNGIPLHQNSFHSNYSTPSPYIGNIITTPVNNIITTPVNNIITTPVNYMNYPADTSLHIISPPPLINPNISNYSLSSQEYVDSNNSFNNISINYNSDTGYNSNTDSYDDSLYYHDIVDNENTSSVSRSNTIGGSQNIRNELKSKSNNQYLHPSSYSQKNNPYGFDSLPRSSSCTYDRQNTYDNNMNNPHSLPIDNNMRMNYPGEIYKNNSVDSSNKSNGYIDHSLNYGYINSMSSSYPVVYNSSFSLSSQSSIVNDNASSYYSGSLRRSGFTNFLNNKKHNNNDKSNNTFIRKGSVNSRSYTDNNGSLGRNRNYNNNYRYKPNYNSHSNNNNYNNYSKDKSKLNNMSIISNSEDTLSKSQQSIKLSVTDENNNQIKNSITMKNDKDTLVEQSDDENETVLPNVKEEEPSIHDDKDKYNENMRTPRVLDKIEEAVNIKDSKYNQKEIKENNYEYDQKELDENDEYGQKELDENNEFDQKELDENNDYDQKELGENNKYDQKESEENNYEYDQKELDENNTEYDQKESKVNNTEDVFSGSLIDDYINESSNSENEEVNNKSEIEKEKNEEEKIEEEESKENKENKREDDENGEGDSDIDDLPTKNDDSDIDDLPAKPEPFTKKMYDFENRRYSSVSFYHLSDTQSTVSRLNKYTISECNFDPYIYESYFNGENTKNEMENNNVTENNNAVENNNNNATENNVVARASTLLSIKSNEADAGYNYERESFYKNAESFVTAYDEEQGSNVNYYTNHEEIENASNYESVRSSLDEFYERRSHKDRESVNMKDRRSERLSIRSKNDFINSSLTSINSVPVNIDSHLIKEKKDLPPPHRIVMKPLRNSNSAANRYSVYSNLSNISNLSGSSYQSRSEEKFRPIPESRPIPENRPIPESIPMEKVANPVARQEPKIIKVPNKKSKLQKTMSFFKSSKKIITKKQNQNQAQSTNSNEKELPPLPNDDYLEQTKTELIKKKQQSINSATNTTSKKTSKKSDFSNKPMTHEW